MALTGGRQVLEEIDNKEGLDALSKPATLHLVYEFRPRRPS